MKTLFHLISFVVKVLVLIVLLPFILIWFLIRYLVFRVVFLRSLIKSGMPKVHAKDLVKETGGFRIF